MGVDLKRQKREGKKERKKEKERKMDATNFRLISWIWAVGYIQTLLMLEIQIILKTFNQMLDINSWEKQFI